VQPIWATKNDLESENEETERLVREAPKKKPPRRDRRRERVNPDRDLDTQGDPDLKNDPDLSLNYKDVGGSVSERVAFRFVAKKDRIKVRRKDTGTVVYVTKEKLREEGSKYELVKPKEDPPWGGKGAQPGETDTEPPWKEKGPPEKPGKEPQKPSEKPPVEEGAQPEKEEKPAEGGPEGPGKGGEKPAEGESPEEEPSAAEAEIDKLIEQDPSFQKALLSVQEKANAYAQKSEGILKELEGLEKDSSPEAAERKKALVDELNSGQDELNSYMEAVQSRVDRAQAKQDLAQQKAEKEQAEAEAEAAKSEAEKAGIKDPQRPEPTEAERMEAMEMVVDTFPPDIAADIIAKGYHPSDLQSMAASYEAAKVSPIPKGDLKDFAAKVGKIYQIDPSKVKPPKTWEKEGREVPFEELSPKEQSEAMRQHQMQTVAMSLAAKDQLTEALTQRTRSGKAQIPEELAGTLADFMLSPEGKGREDQAKKLASQTFKITREKGEAENIKDGVVKKLLGSLPKEAQQIASGFLQANDYLVAREKFLDSGEISEHQSPGDIVSGFRDLDSYFQKRSKLYPGGNDQHAGKLLQSQIRTRLKELDQRKYGEVRKRLDSIAADEYDIAEGKWRKARKAWEVKKKKHQQKVREYDNAHLITDWKSLPEGHPGEFTEAPPEPPKKPLRYDLVRGKRPRVWEEQFRRMGQKVASRYLKSFYPCSVPMDSNSRTGAYHGVEPADNYPPEGYAGWQQAHQRDLGESDYDIILQSAREWMKSPVLSKDIDGYLPDMQLRAALDLAIQSSPYNRAINPQTYNILLARLANTPPEEFLGQTLRSATVLVRTAGSSYVVEKMSLVVYGKGPFNIDVIRAIEGQYFQYRDEEGNVRDDGYAHVDDVKYGRALPRMQELQGFVPEGSLNISYPKGAAAEAFKAVQAACRKHKLQVEKAKPGYKPSFRKMPGSKTRRAQSSKGEDSMNKQAANGILGRLDRLADNIQNNHEKMGMGFDTAKGLVNELDRVADEIEKEAFGEESLHRRQAEVLQRDQDEPYMDTFNAPMAPVQTDSDEPYMDAFVDDQSVAVDDGKSQDGKELTPNN